MVRPFEYVFANIFLPSFVCLECSIHPTTHKRIISFLSNLLCKYSCVNTLFINQFRFLELSILSILPTYTVHSFYVQMNQR